MIVGVVSDTHNYIKNIRKIIDIFNNECVDIVIHTGDITKPETLKIFSELNCSMIGVFGNNDRTESGFGEVCEELNFDLRDPPYLTTLRNRKIAIFHETDLIPNFIKENRSIDLVLHGHTHRYREESIDKVTYFNPGESAGLIEGKNALGIINLSNLEIKRIFF